MSPHWQFNPTYCLLPLILDPTQPVVQTVELEVNFALAQELYRVKLTVTISTASRMQVLMLLAAFTSTLVYATASQFSCYWLDGNAFREEPYDGGSPVSRSASSGGR